jgi:putative flippase GtrA
VPGICLTIPIHHRFVRFVLVGGTATVIQYLVLTALVAWSRVEPWIASDVGFTLSAVYNYNMNRWFTFESREPYLASAGRFALLVTLGVMTNTIIMRGLTQLGLHYLLAQVAASAVVLTQNFSLANFWVFAGQKGRQL